ncbi:16146_t:CDS:1, partial [Dentiscutata heterogama]
NNVNDNRTANKSNTANNNNATNDNNITDNHEAPNDFCEVALVVEALLM